jgi:hypothetical protein
MKTYDLPRIVSVQKEKNVNAYVVLEFDSYRDFIMKIMFEDEIDEDHYLSENPDVRKAVEGGPVTTSRAWGTWRAANSGRLRPVLGTNRRRRSHPFRNAADSPIDDGW